MENKLCGDCGAEPGSIHEEGCDIETCPNCGGQLLSCDCQVYRLVWTGVDEPTKAAIEYGWYSIWTGIVGMGWKECDKETNGASPDLNRVFRECVWDKDQGRFVKKGE